MNKQKFEDKITELKANEKQDVNHGEIIVIRAYIDTKENTDSDVLVIGCSLWKHEIDEVIQALHKFDVKKFVISDTSTALMSTLQMFMENDFKIEGASQYVRKYISDSKVEKGLSLSL